MSGSASDGKVNDLSRKVKIIRVAALAVVLLSVAALVRGIGGDDLSVESVRASVINAGAFGVAVYVISFIAALVAFVPPILLVGLAAVVWGPWLGMGIAWLTGVVAVQAVFALGRFIGGQPSIPNRPLLQRLVGAIERRPLRSVIAIRLAFRLGPVVTATLAISPLRAADHLLGTAIGLLPWMVVGVFFVDLIA